MLYQIIRFFTVIVTVFSFPDGITLSPVGGRFGVNESLHLMVGQTLRKCTVASFSMTSRGMAV